MSGEWDNWEAEHAMQQSDHQARIVINLEQRIKQLEDKVEELDGFISDFHFQIYGEDR